MTIIRHLHESQNLANTGGRTPFGAGVRTPARTGQATPGHASVRQPARTPNPYGGATPGPRYGAGGPPPFGYQTPRPGGFPPSSTFCSSHWYESPKSPDDPGGWLEQSPLIHCTCLSSTRVCLTYIPISCTPDLVTIHNLNFAGIY